ncbi:hypothetical protein NKJ09_21190 [Mesorhizobium sp. M0189]|uniref:hypothetical protein n=1 Tax=Mesorhizobium sp. M0189 TaxID=2956909 RepID=UPI00333B4EDE
MQQFEAKFGLELLNGACHRRLGTPEHVSRLGDAAAGSNRKEGLKVPSFHIIPTCEIRMIDIVSFIFDICQAETNVHCGFGLFAGFRAGIPIEGATRTADAAPTCESPDEKRSGHDGKDSRTTKPTTGGILCA